MNPILGVRLEECSELKNMTGTTIGSIQSKTRGNVGEIMNLTSYRDDQYDWLIGDSENGVAIKQMIKEYPYIWQNIKFKFKDYTTKLKANKTIEEKLQAREILVDEIIKIFMKPSGHNPFLKETKANILKTINEEIADNDSLYQYIDGHSAHSFIEYPNTKLKNLSERKDWGGFWLLIRNISGRTLKNWDSEIRHFNKIFEEVIEYANRIFHIDLHTSLSGFKNEDKKDVVRKFKNFDEVGSILKNAMLQWGTFYRDATFFIKALYAWSDLPRIKIAHTEAINAQSAFFAFLNGPDEKGTCTEDNEEPKLSRKWVDNTEEAIHRKFTYTYTFENGRTKSIKITTRVKSVESILIKLFADEHYGDIDALNDLLGIRMFLGDLDAEEKTEIIHYFWTMMGKNSAIFKNKSYLDDYELKVLNEKWRILNSMPIGIESRVKNRSSLEYRDCKYSGYLREDIYKDQIGTEIQFFDNEDEPNPKGAAHHSILDAKKIVQWWYRGAHIITGKQISEVIRLRCFREDNSWLSFGHIFKEIYNTLVPYVHPKVDSHGDTEMAFAVRWYESLIQGEFPSMRPLHEEDYQLFLIYIGQLGRDFEKSLFRN